MVSRRKAAAVCGLTLLTIPGVSLAHSDESSTDAAVAGHLRGAPVAKSRTTEPRFEERTAAAGLEGLSGPSFGVAWGDANGDGWPDLWIGNHGQPPRLMLNNGAGAFVDATGLLPASAAAGDQHGAAWADFDRDGDEDLLVTAGRGFGGSPSPNLLLVNTGDAFVEESSTRGVRYAEGRGRMPTWTDWNRDGLLDLMVANWTRTDGLSPTTVFTQLADRSFVDDGGPLAVVTQSDHNHAVRWHDLGIGADLLVLQHGFGTEAFDTDQVPWVSRNDRLDDAYRGSHVTELLVADLNGDLTEDLYFARYAFVSGADVVDDVELRSALVSNAGQNESLGFTTIGPVTLSDLPAEDVRIGESGLQPQSMPVVLDPLDPEVHGLLDDGPSDERQFLIGWDEQSARWTVLTRSPTRWERGFIIRSESPISDLVTDFRKEVDQPDQAYFQLADGSLVPADPGSGLTAPSSCESIVAADFDNDGDLDLYRTCRGAATNRPNQYLENLGGGVFEAQQGHGAEGTSAGIGDTAAVADYDGDGFLDLVVVNGRGGAPFNDGPVQLFRNLGTEGHWLQLQLEGVASNPHGVGARVRVSGGGLLQERAQTGGERRYGQDFRVLHFGLGPTTAAVDVQITWPSGVVQTLAEVPVNQRLPVREDIGASAEDGVLRVTGSAETSGQMTLVLNGEPVVVHFEAGATADELMQQLVDEINAVSPGSATLVAGVVVIDNGFVTDFSADVPTLSTIVLEPGAEGAQVPLPARLLAVMAMLLLLSERCMRCRSAHRPVRAPLQASAERP